MRERRIPTWLAIALAGILVGAAIPWRGPDVPATHGTEVEVGGARGPSARSGAADRAADSIRIYLHLRPRDLHPHTAGYAAESQVTGCIFESLLAPDRSELGCFHPALASRWETSADGRTLLFHLRRDVEWHDGRPFSAADVVFTFDYVRDPSRRAPLRPFLDTFESCEALDRFTVRFRVREPSWRTFPMLVGRLFSILPRHCLDGAGPEAEAAFGRGPVGTGPYRLGSWDQNANRIELVQFARYRGPRPRAPAIVFKTYTDRVAALADFRSGALDFFPRLRPDDFFGWAEPAGWGPERVRAALEVGQGTFRLPEDTHRLYRLGGFATSRVSFVAWNCRRGPCAERAVRIALAHLLDRHALGGGRSLGRPVTGDQIWFGPNYDDSVQPHAFAPELARRQLADAGWFDRDGDGLLDRDGGPLRIRIVYPAEADDEMLQRLAAEARRVGILVVPEGLERGRFLRAKQSRDFDGLFLAWVLAPEEDPYWAWHSSFAAEGDNHSGYRDADALIEQVRAAADSGTRRTLLRTLQARIHEAQPVLFVQSETQLAAWSQRLQGVRFFPLTETGWDVTDWSIDPGAGR